jgi:hypothetical protein
MFCAASLQKRLSESIGKPESDYFLAPHAIFRLRLIWQNPNDIAGMIRLPTQHEPDDRQASHSADSSAIIIAAAFIMRLGQDGDSDCGTDTGSNSGAYYPPFAAVSSGDANVTHVCPRHGLAGSLASSQNHRVAFDG